MNTALRRLPSLETRYAKVDGWSNSTFRSTEWTCQIFNRTDNQRGWSRINGLHTGVNNDLDRDAFRKFRNKLELNPREQDDASKRQKEIRGYMDQKFHIEDDFLTGSYKRWTKTKPLKDVDIFCVLGDDERHFRDKPPQTLLTAVEEILARSMVSSSSNRSEEISLGKFRYKGSRR